MSGIKSEPYTTNLFKSFREDNLSLITEINTTIDQLLQEIGNDQNLLINKIDNIDKKVEDLRSIFFSFHSMAGSEKLIRLKQLISRYRLDSEKNRNRIAAAEFLIRKIEELLQKHGSRDYEPFRMSEDFSYEFGKKQSDHDNRVMDRKYKWVTFKRNNSWFISRFSDLEIIEAKEFYTHNKLKSGIILETVNNEKIEAVDLMRNPGGCSKPSIGIRLFRQGSFFAADIKGREIYASKDFITPMTVRIDIKNPLYTGRVRLFGRNHFSLTSKKINPW